MATGIRQRRQLEYFRMVGWGRPRPERRCPECHCLFPERGPCQSFRCSHLRGQPVRSKTVLSVSELKRLARLGIPEGTEVT